MKSEDLKPCPFCGNNYLTVIHVDGTRETVECFHCNATGPLGYSILQACELWNDRPEANA